MPKRDEAHNLQLAFSLHRNGQLAEAGKLYRKIIKFNPGQPHALHYLGTIEAANGNNVEAARLMARSLSIQTANVQFMQNYATVLCQLGQYETAGAVCLKGLVTDRTNAYLLYVLAGALFKQNRLQDSLLKFDELLLLQPNHIAAVTERSSVLMALKQYDGALAGVEQAIALDPQYADAHLNRGNLCGHLKRYEEAAKSFEHALRLKPGLGDAWLGYGNVLLHLDRGEEALAAYERALSLNPDSTAAWLGRGNAFADLKRYGEAFAAYDKALSLAPDMAEASLGRGNVFFELGRHDEALAAHHGALSLKPDLAAAWLGRGNALAGLRRYREAIAAYDEALSLAPGLTEAWLCRGNVFCDLRRHEEALAAYDRALSLAPDLAEAWLGRGNVFFGLGRHGEALAAYDRAASLKPDFAAAWLGRGTVLFEFKRFGEAVAAWDRALALPLKPDLLAVEGDRIFAKMHLCDWSNFEAECEHLVQSMRNGEEKTSPFPFLGMSPFIQDQLHCAKLWARRQYQTPDKPCWRGDRYKHDKIRLGYVSADFRQHPVAYLLAGVFECHDRSQFEITGISIGPDDKSEIRRRLEHSFDRLVEAATSSTDDVARQIREQEIDVLIDLTGFTQNARPQIFARRPAPIQVNYLGYPGTMGAEFIDYIISDPVLVPVSHQKGYAEKIAYLPHSYMPHDDKSRAGLGRSFKRAEFGLPENGFVFCCFNNAYKLNPALFQSRMKILKAVEGSALWLTGTNSVAVDNLRREAMAAGIDPDRLIFADRLPSAADHLARHRLADLFLDTLPYNAHTTASDALWAGLPVLTQIGETFAGRVGASLLTAIGLPELIAQTQEQFENMAIDLARQPGALAAIRDKLAQNRSTAPLFETKLYTRHIESAYATMHERHQNGFPPDHIYVPH
jgi:protein O-GlcNAc transferase